ncbi:MAG TPA: phytanoyl-CoA dioxygenase family protein [Mycobacteriales bacterium]|nr:phytanoyl-CoA dioxygenase family protein [Mycobacteriales bacterium]
MSTLTIAGHVIDTAPQNVGELRRSRSTDPDLADRLAEDGYLFLPGYLDREQVLAARADLLAGMAAAGMIAPGTDPADAIPASDSGGALMHELARDSAPLQHVLYGPRMIALYEQLFGEPVRHFDYTWLRMVAPGQGTRPHMDNVFMNRGSARLLTAWTPLGDIDRTLGGVTVLAGSHRLEEITSTYAQRDVDVYCSNADDADENAGRETLMWSGVLTEDPEGFRAEHGLRWLTTDYRAGDLLTFTMYTAHGGLDNHSGRFRISSDSRYQPASEPADPRWIGPDPSAHGSRSKQGVIC